MKHKMNKLSRETFLEKILEDGGMPDEEERKKIYRYVTDKDENIRYYVAEILGFRCNDDDELILRRMTYDREWLVKVNAIDSLGMGIQERSQQRLYQLMTCGQRMVRGYAVGSYFDIWVNRYGYTESSMKRYRENIAPLYQREKDPWVRISYEANRYHSGDRDGIKAMKDLICEARGDQYRVQSAAIYMLLNSIRNLFNEQEVNRIFEEVSGYVDDYLGAKKDMLTRMNAKETPRILIVSSDNSGLSLLLEYQGVREEETWWTDSAGISPADEVRDEVKKCLRRTDCDLTRYYYPGGIRQVWRYDYIVPIGIRLQEDEYPFQRIIRMFENKDESMTDLKKAKEMWKELSEFIKVDRKCRKAE